MNRALLLGCVLAALSVAAFSVPAVPAALMDLYAPRARPFEAADVPQARAVVVLGGGADRVLEVARVYRLLDRPWVVSSGGDRNDGSGQSSAGLMHDALVRLGVPDDRILLESESSTTREEARLVAPMLSRLGCRTFVLVTSRSHMPRAMAVFRAQGLDPVAAPAPDPAEPNVRARSWRFGRSGLRLSRTLAHEVLGFAYYWIRGWTAPAGRHV